MSAAASPTLVDARPVRPVSADTCWDRAVALREQLAAQVREALALILHRASRCDTPERIAQVRTQLEILALEPSRVDQHLSWRRAAG